MPVITIGCNKTKVDNISSSAKIFRIQKSNNKKIDFFYIKLKSKKNIYNFTNFIKLFIIAFLKYLHFIQV